MATTANYTYAQLEGLWINAGGSAATAPIAAAIAMAESGGNPTVTSANPDGGTNVGPWQLDTLGVGSGYSVAQLQDPAVNAAVAVNGSANGTNWSDWETYANGAYKAFLSNGTTPDTAGLPAAATTAATLTSATTSGTACALSVPIAGCILPKSALRGVIGGLCLGAAGIIGLAAMVILAASAFEHSGAAGVVAQTAGKVAPVGRVVQATTPAARQERQLSRRESAVGQKERVSRLEKREKRAAS
jgi:hypothetical protein